MTSTSLSSKSSEKMNVTIIQPDMIWRNADHNLGKYSCLLKNVNVRTDLILLPEMFNTGFCTDPFEISETMEGKTIQWMKHTAAMFHCSIAGSLIVKEGDQYFNRLIYSDKDGNISFYDKRHLFRMANEEIHFSPGNKNLIVTLKKWKLNFQVCYDLRFPVWSRNCNNYDILIYVANWPAARMDVWDTLLKARAIENQSFVIGVNRIGKDGNGIKYSGNSMVIHPKGNVIGELKSSKEEVATFSLLRTEMNAFRDKFPAWKDRDEFYLKI
jgi:omega-amidase